MNPERLLALYDRVAEAPEAVPRLRRFILDLAVRGKLVEQDPADEPASELLNRIAAEKARLARIGAIRKQKTFPPITNWPFRIPQSWQWVHFGDIVEFSAGKTPPRHEPVFWDNGKYPWVRIADMQDGRTILETREKVSEEARCRIFKSSPSEPGIIIFSFKLTIGKIARLGISAYFNEAIISIRPYMDEFDPWFFMFLPLFARSGKTISAVKGATLNRKSISNILIPLPPLAEQRRIVAKVSELMAFCDRLEAARTKREETRDRLTKASLGRLSAPDTDLPTFRSHARFVVNAIPALTRRADQIKQLRQSILDLAVRGKLVEQDPADEPASELLKRIAAEKVRLVKVGKIKRKVALDLPVAGTPFNIPRTWVWVSLATVFFYDAGIKRSPKALDLSYWLLELEDIEKDSGTLIRRVRVDERASKSTKSEFQPGDILYGKLRPYLNKVLVADESGYSTTEIVALRPYLPLSPGYCALALRRPDFVEYVTKLGQGTKMPRLRTQDAVVAPFPLPPLAEQSRISSKVNELMSLCDQLETNLEITSKSSQRYLDLLVQNML